MITMGRLKPSVVLLTLLALLLIVPPAFASDEVLQPGVNFSTALRLEPGTYSFNILTPTDVHYFSVYLKRGQTIYVTLLVPERADFDLYLYSPTRSFIAFGSAYYVVPGQGVAERLAYVAVEEGLHYIIVSPFAGSSGAYQLMISVQDPEVLRETVTVTVTTHHTVTQFSIREAPMTVEKIVTVTVVEEVRPSELPWITIGMASLAVAIVAAAIIVRSLEGATTRPERKE